MSKWQPGAAVTEEADMGKIESTTGKLGRNLKLEFQSVSKEEVVGARKEEKRDQNQLFSRVHGA